MTYAAALLKQEIARRLGGQCRIDLQTGALRAMDGDRHQSCADCPGHCLGSRHATGLAGANLSVEVADAGGGAVRLSWPCPGCGRTTTEDASVLSAHAVANEVESDPLYHRCRSTGRGTGA